MITTAIIAWCTLLALAPPRRPFAVGADPAMVFIAGNSSGGQLAALAALTPK